MEPLKDALPTELQHRSGILKVLIVNQFNFRVFTIRNQVDEFASDNVNAPLSFVYFFFSFG